MMADVVAFGLGGSDLEFVGKITLKVGLDLKDELLAVV